MDATPSEKRARGAEVRVAPHAAVVVHYSCLLGQRAQRGTWARALVARLEQVVGVEVAAEVFQQVGVCPHTGLSTTEHGAYTDNMKARFTKKLPGIEMDNVSREEVEKCLTGMEDPAPSRLLPGLQTMLTSLRDNVSQIAVVCTDPNIDAKDELSKGNLLDNIDILHRHIATVATEDVDDVHVESILRKVGDKLGVDIGECLLVSDNTRFLGVGHVVGYRRMVGVVGGTSTRLQMTPYGQVVDDVINLSQTLCRIDLVAPMTRPGKVGAKVTPELVIFDKDGTLLCFESAWTPMAMNFVQRLEDAVGLCIARQVLRELGYDFTRGRWGHGVYAEGTTAQNIAVVLESLATLGVHSRVHSTDAEAIVVAAWQAASLSFRQQRRLDDPVEIFHTLRAQGIKIAVCTSDDRHNTERFLEDIGATELVDKVVCGDDSDNVPKPAADNALLICRQLGVRPNRAVVVGDTAADLGMGRAAGLGLTIGVLSGVGCRDTLSPLADYLMPSIKHLPKLLL